MLAAGDGGRARRETGAVSLGLTGVGDRTLRLLDETMADDFDREVEQERRALVAGRMAAICALEMRSDGAIVLL